MTNYFTRVVCLECKHEQEADLYAASCSKCGSPWLDAQYDYDAVADRWSAAVLYNERSLWRYRDLLPVIEPDPEISMGEGLTALNRLRQYEKRFNHEGIFLKDERGQPTNSFKDRQAALSVLAMKRRGVTETVLASTGNAAVAYAAYCARAQIKLWLFLTSLVPAEKMRELALYGAEVVKVSGTYDETKKVAAAFAKRKGIPIDQGAKTIPAKESMKTIAFEIAEQLSLALRPDEPGKWVAPDWYVQSVSGGIGPIGVWKGFSELHRMKLIDRMPRLALIQAAGCSPMVQAFEAGKDTADPVVPKTLIQVLATGDPGFAYVLLNQAVRSNGGTMIAVEDGETFRAMRHLASHAGIAVEPATAVAFAGLEKMFERGVVQSGERVVVNVSGHTLPAESHILGDQYDKYILNLQTADLNAADDSHTEGLGAALKNLDEQVTSIVVIDDNINDRRLIKRLLKGYKNYRVYEAADGLEGIDVIKQRQPDLVVCDLSMPRMDGLKLLEALKTDDAMREIPVVVVTAKSLTTDDRRILDQYSESVWTKGGFETRQLLDHVIDRLGHTPVGVIQQERPSSQKRINLENADTPGPDDHIIVVIDDNANDLRLAQRMLQTDDYHIITENNGRDGLKAIYNYHPDLVILDLMMPEIDGFAILNTLQDDPVLRDIPVVVVSAKKLTLDEQQLLEARLATIIEKASLDRQRFLNIIKGKLTE